MIEKLRYPLELFDKTLARREVWSWRNSRACLFRANLPLFIYSPWRVTSWRATLLVAEEKEKKKEKERREKKERTRTSIYRGKLYHLEAQLTKKKKRKGKERKEQIISTFKLESWKGIVSTLVLENCLSVLNSGRHLRKVGRKISFSPLPAMIYFYSNFSVPV